MGLLIQKNGLKLFGKKKDKPAAEKPSPPTANGGGSNKMAGAMAGKPSPSSSPPPLGAPVGVSGAPTGGVSTALDPKNNQDNSAKTGAPAGSDLGMPIDILLEQLTAMMKQPVSRDVIRAGLPIDGGFVSAAAHNRAIKQADLKVKKAKTFKGRNGAPTPFLIQLANHKVAVGLRWNADGSLDVMGMDKDSEGKPSIRLIPANQLKTFLPKEVLSLKRVARAIRKSSDNTKLTGLGRFEHWFWPIIKSQWPGYVYACFAVLLVNLMMVMGSFYAMLVYNRVLPTMALDTLWTLTIGVMIAHTFGFIIKNLQTYFLDTAGRKIDKVASSEMFYRVMAIKTKDRPKNSGSFAGTFRDFENVREFFSSVTLTAVIEIPFSFVFIIAIFIVAGPLGYIPLIMGPMMVILSLILQILISRAIADSMQAGSEKNAILLESLSGIETVKSLNAESSFQQRWEDSVEVAADASRLMRLMSGISNAFTQYVRQVSTVLILVFGVYLAVDQQITMGGILAATMLTGRAIQPYMKLTPLLGRFEQVKRSLEVIEKISVQDSEWTPEHERIDHPVKDGSIEFNKVTFSYPDTSTPVIQDASFKIEQGERVGVIGPSGSGKSTLSKLILGLYEAESGSVQIGGIDNRQYNPRTLRRAVGYSPQDPFIFGGTVAENIQYGNDQAGTPEVLEAAKMAGVDIFTASHPDGMMLQVGELGRNLSGGQRQALSLARTFIKDCQILVLDEPTNSLDGQTETILLNTLRNQPKDRTIVVITHRPVLLQVVDRLICMDKSKIVMDGGRDEVMARLGAQVPGRSIATASGPGGAGKKVTPPAAMTAPKSPLAPGVNS